MTQYYLDAELFTDKEAAHDYIAERMDFPAYYGKNLDALYDCLTELSECEIYIDHADLAGSYGRLVIEVFTEATEVNENLAVYLMEDEEEISLDPSDDC